MFKEVKSVIIIILVLFSSCINSNQEEINKAKMAEILLVEAKDALAKDDPIVAMQYIEQIDSVYKEQVDIRREALKLKPQIKERLIVKEIQIIDSLLVEYEINNPGVEIVYKARVKKDRLERQLQVARNQAVRLNDNK